MLKDYPVKKWRLETRDFNLESFDESSQRQLLARMRGEPQHWPIHRDQERHEKQAEVIKKTGTATQEPIIVFKKSDSSALELVEGWHRTIQNLLAFPDGWRSRAWVGYI